MSTVGSNSNVGENGMENEADRAAILEIDRASGQRRVFASGLRNPVGMAWQPQTRGRCGSRSMSGTNSATISFLTT